MIQTKSVFRMIALLGSLMSVSAPAATAAQNSNVPARDEPAYCDPEDFGQLAVTPPTLSGKIERLHAFQLGNVVVAGMAIGSSSTKAMEELAIAYSPTADQANYCTWFVGDNNASAQKAFNYHQISFWSLRSIKHAVPAFMGALNPSFSSQEVHNFIACAANYKYIAVGCDGQRHRGPSVFGMLLAFSGCSAAHATTIANNLWGLNGIAPQVRQAIVQAAYDLGSSHPDERAEMARQFGHESGNLPGQ